MERRSKIVNNQKVVIAQIHPLFLGISEIFIHRWIAGIKQFRPLVVTEEVVNENIYEFSRHYEVRKISSPRNFAFRVFAKSMRMVSPAMYDYTAKHAAFSQILQREHVKMIHAHYGHIGWFCLPLQRLLKLPLIVSFHGMDASALPQDPIWRKRYLKLFKQADFITTPSQFIADLLEDLGCNESKIHVIHPGIDLEKWPLKQSAIEENTFSKSTSVFSIMMVARHVEKKGIIYGIQAISKLSKKYPNILLRIVGEGPERHDNEIMISDHRLSDKVVLLGSMPNSEVACLMRESHVLIAPSVTASNGETEGLPSSIIEAAATGLPVVASYHAGIPEFIDDGENGFVVPERNSDALAEKLEKLIENPELRNSMGLIGRRKVEKEYSTDMAGRRLEDIYEELLSRR